VRPAPRDPTGQAPELFSSTPGNPLCPNTCLTAWTPGVPPPARTLWTGTANARHPARRGGNTQPLADPPSSALGRLPFRPPPCRPGVPDLGSAARRRSASESLSSGSCYGFWHLSPVTYATVYAPR